ncbi:MAG: hypothetical protein KDK78_09325, partial [Chlamydiia bacterium]|nr:hypothetical protein [Chlamydiia bacterium]
NLEGETALMQAARRGDTLALKQLGAAAGIDLGAQSKEGKDALMYATARGCASATALLLDLGAPYDSVDNAGERAIDSAFDKKDRACCRVFWDRNLYLNHVNSCRAAPDSPLSLCLDWGEDTQLMRELVEKGTDVNIRHREGLSAVHAAVQRVAVKTLAALVELKADLDATDAMQRTPLELVVRAKRTEDSLDFVQRLCAGGANPSLPMSDGNYPLVFSARRLQEITSKADRLLGFHGHGFNKPVEARIPSEKENRWRELVQVLISANAELNSQDGEGNTALHYCGKMPFRKVELWKRLRQAGASAKIRNLEGRRPFLHFPRAFKEESLYIGTLLCATIVGLPFGLIVLVESGCAHGLDRAGIGNFWLQRWIERR